MELLCNQALLFQLVITPVVKCVLNQLCFYSVLAYPSSKVWYNQLVDQTNCTGSNDTLSCLRNVPYEDMKTVINRTPNYYSYESLDLVWVPRADGIFLVDNPQRLVANGTVANIPFVSGK